MLRKRLEDVDQKDLEDLVRDRAEETRQVEFKRQLDLGNDKERREAAKDVSAMANGGGGRIVYGIEEKADSTGRKIATAVVGMTDGTLRDRLEEVLASTIRPPVQHRVRRVELIGATGLHCLVIEVEADPYVLHMLEAYGERTYYTRLDPAARAMGEDDVRRRYEAIERLRSRGEDHVRAAMSEEFAKMPGGCWLSVVAIPLAGREDSVDLATDPSSWRCPASTGYSRGFVLKTKRDLTPRDDALEHTLGFDNRTSYLLRVRRDGVVHAGTSNFRDGQHFWPGTIAGTILDCAYLAGAVSDHAGIVGPIRIELFLRNDNPVPEVGSYHFDATVLPERELRRGCDLRGRPWERVVPVAVKALMDFVYQAGGRKRCEWIDEDGNVAGKRVQDIWE